MSAVAKQKRCRQCRELFPPFKSTEVVCSPRCAIAYSRANPEKVRKLARRADRVETREGLEKLKTRRDYEREAQRHFNAWVRERDKLDPCISCGRNTGAKRNAGHYLSVGSHPELRFEPDNCHSQCEHCNSWKSGNAVDYRVRLIAKIGPERVEWLEGPHEPAKRTSDDLKAISKQYRVAKRSMIRAREMGHAA